MSKKNKEQIKQRIRQEWGEYERERRKEYLYYKNCGRLDLYYKKKIPMMAKLSSPATHLRNIVGNLSWWQKIYIILILGFKRLQRIIIPFRQTPLNLFKRLWRKLFQSKI